MWRATRPRPTGSAWRRTEGGGNTLGRLPRCSPRTGSMPGLSGQCRSRRRRRRERVCGSMTSSFSATRSFSVSATRPSRNSWPRPRQLTPQRVADTLSNPGSWAAFGLTAPLYNGKRPRSGQQGCHQMGQGGRRRCQRQLEPDTQQHRQLVAVRIRFEGPDPREAA